MTCELADLAFAGHLPLYLVGFVGKEGLLQGSKLTFEGFPLFVAYFDLLVQLFDHLLPLLDFVACFLQLACELQFALFEVFNTDLQFFSLSTVVRVCLLALFLLCL